MTAARRSRTPAPVLRHLDEVVLPDGKRLTPGREFTIPKIGRFSFRYCYEPDGSITAFGPLGRPSHARLRSFRPEQVRTVHNERDRN
jgi:hypothetical protein